MDRRRALQKKRRRFASSLPQEKTYRTAVKIGNWNEDLCLEEDLKREYLEKKERGELAAQKVDFLKNNTLNPVNLSAKMAGGVHFGDVVMLVNLGGKNRDRSALSINADVGSMTKIPSPSLRSPCGVSAGRGTDPCTRTAFVITSVDGSPGGSALHFEQSFGLKTTGDFAKELYLTSDTKRFYKCAKKSRLQEVTLDDNESFLSWWKIVYFDPQERLEYEGLPVPGNVKVVVVHCKTNQALAVLGDQVLWTTYGKEYEVVAHTFLDTHRAEQDNNHWILCTSDPARQGLISLSRREPGANSVELTQANTAI